LLEGSDGPTTRKYVTWSGDTERVTNTARLKSDEMWGLKQSFAISSEEK